MLKRSVSSPVVFGSILVGTGVVLVGAGALALRRKRQKGRPGGSGLVVPLRPPEATLAGDEELLVGGRTEMVVDFAEAVRAAMPTPVLVGGNGASASVFEEGLRAMADGLDGVAPFGEPQFRQPSFREPDVAGAERSRRWRPARVSAPVSPVASAAVVPAVEPYAPGVEVPVLDPVDGRPRRSNYRIKRARQFMADRLREEERWARFMGRKDTRGVVSPSTLSMTEVDRHDELSQLGQIEMEIFTDGRPSGDHDLVSIGRFTRSWMWFRMRVLGEK